MKTFTNYAEKKAKQFLNLLQGYTKGIRLTAILILLLMGVNSAWAYDQSAVDLYFDNSTAQWTNCYVYIGHGSYTSCYAMSRVSGTQYLWKLPSNFNSGNKWGGASGWVVSNENWWNSSNEDVYKFVYHGNKKVTNIRTSAWNATTIYKADGTQSVTHYNTACTVYKWSTSTKSDYTVTINSPTGGTLTVKDYDNNTVSSGASKIKLTVLKFSASASTGYTFGGVQINNGSTTTTIDAADIDSETYTLTSNVTITPIWTEKTYSVTISAGTGGTVSPSGSKTIGQVTKTTVTATPNANYEFVNWTATGGVVVANASSASTTITATTAGTLTANFRSTATNSLTVVAGANIESVTGSTDPVTLGSTYAITATPKTGYTFSTWTANPAANATFGSATTANTNVTVKNGSVTVTATAEEIMSTLTTANAYDNGNPGYAAPTKSVNSIGIATTATVTATAAGEGYTFEGWTLTNCTRTDGGADDATFITVRSNGDGAAATVTANYEQIPPTTVYFKPTDSWKEYDAWFAVYYWESSNNGWVSMTNVDCNGDYYTAEVPGGYSNMMFVRLKPSTADGYNSSNSGLHWDNKWEQTYDLSVPTDNNVLYDMASTNITHLYLKPNSNWANNSTRNSAYFYGNGEKWVSMTKEDNETGYYIVEIPSGYPNVIFCSMNKNTSENSWKDKWNQTGNLTIPTNGNNLFTLPDESWDGATTTWSTIYDDSKWTTYTPPTYEITLSPTIGGTIMVTPVGGSPTTENTSVTVNTLVTISLDPSEGYTKGTAKIKIGNNDAVDLDETQQYTICGPTEITAEFVPTNPTPVYLKVTDHNWQNDDAWFAIYWWNSTGNGWVKMENVDCNGDYYYGEVAAGAIHFTFVRLIPEGHDDYDAGTNGDGMNWDNDWAQTINLDIQGLENNLYIVGDKNSESKYTGSWSTYTPPTYEITLSPRIGGAITTDPASPVEVNTEVTVTMTPSTDYAFRSGSIKIGTNEAIDITQTSSTHTICGPTEITAEFVTASEQVVYLKPTSEWNFDSPTFAVHVWNNSGDEGALDIDMTPADCNGDYYIATIPAGYHSMVFYRKSTDGTDVWNKTADLDIPVNTTNNCYTITSTGSKEPFSAAEGSWTTYTPPTYDITINAPESGTISVTIDGSTTNVTTEAVTIEDVALNTEMTVAFTGNAGYNVGKAIIQVGNNAEANAAGTYEICGPTEITAYFVTAEDQVVYLRPNDNWLADNALFYAYAFNRYGGNEWIELVTEETDYTGAYGCTIRAGYSDVIFVRINPTADEPSWDDGVKWNQSVDYVIPVNTTNNRFIIGEKITAEGADKDKYQGSWEASDRPIYGIPGDWQNEWAAGDYPLMGPDGEVTVNITQTNDTLGFKVYQYPYGSDNNSAQWLSNYGTMVRGGEAVHEGGWTMEAGPNNCGLAVDVAGDYVFHFNIRESKLTVQYPPMPVPSPITLSAQRVFEDEVLAYDWVAGDGTEANPYQLYADEAARITVSSLPEVEGLTAYYQFGNNEEQTSNVFDWKYISSQATTMEVKAYYKNAMGAKSAEATVNTSYFKTLALPFYLMTQPKDEINIDRIAAGTNITVQFRSDSKATVDLYLNDTEGTPLTKITNKDSYDFEYDVPDDIEPCILTFIAKAQGAGLHGRIFEVKTDVAIYKNVIIKVNDPEGWVKNVYMWRDYSDAVLTPWPGDPVLQNYGTWRVFSVKYPYYDRFIINDGNTGENKQTIDWVLPADDTCYELLDPENNGSDLPEDVGKYGLQVADCPENLIVEEIEDVTLMEGEQIVVMPKIYVGLGYQVADIEASVHYDNNGSITAMMSGTNVTILGNAEGESNVTVTYILDDIIIAETFKVTVTKKNKITIQVKVPIANGGTYDNIGWSNNDLIKIHYWFTGKEGDIPLRYVYEEANKFKYLQAEVPLDAEGKTNFLIGYDDINENWEKTADIPNVETDGCYTLKNAGWGNSPTATLDGIVCWDENDYAQYQVKILMGSGKTYTSNIVTAEEDTLSFFAPGMNETGYKAGVVMLYQNDKMIATIEPSTFAVSNVYTATLNDALNGLDNVSTYSGNFYIRTYGTSHANIGFNNGKGWHSIKDLTAVEKDSVRFTYFISRKGEFYNHYWVQDMNTGGYDGKNVSACVANDYNDDLAGKLTKGKGTDESGDIKVGSGKVINVRFGYDPRTNYFGRAIIKGSEYDNYLNIHCDNAYKDKNCSTKLPYGTSGLENKMQDISNWVYQRDFYVPITNSYPSASLYVEATSPSTEMTVTDHLLGYVINEITGEETTTPVQRTVIGSGTNNGTYLMRVVYDFKTNRIIAAWLPQGTIEVTDDRTLNADVLFVRNENNDVPQIQLANEGKIRSLESMYFALELERGDKNAANRHEEQYFFTLPFNSIVGSISGVPGYMQTWGIQRYRGDLRAQKGWFIETPTFWEWMSLTDTLYAGEGYALVFDKKAAAWNEIEVDKTDAEGNIMYETDQNGDTIYENGAPKALKDTISMMRLYFPSDTSGFNMQQQSAEHLIRTYPNHPCTITRENRDKQDSNWKVIGTTSYNNAGIKEYVEDTDPEYEELNGNTPPKFRYKYTYTMSNDNKTFTYTYEPENGETATYKSFFGYMVQFAGTITWQPIMSETVPEGIAARRRVAEGERTSYTTRLELANANGEKQDQAFVALDEKATTTFDQNKDLNKIINAGKANIYTLSENIPFAGNTLPMEKVTVPVGVVVKEVGEYTFRMPDGTDGIAVTLVDNVTGTHTNMLMNEYTVTLNAGTIENRFYLVVDPDRTATSVENVGSGANGDEAKGVEKFLIDGKLFIRTTDGIFDAKGQRL